MAATLQLLAGIALSCVLVSGKAPPENCALGEWEKVGCFRDDYVGKTRVYPYELVNHRDPLNANWDGHTLDWHQWPQSVHALTCKCADMARELNYKFFGLQFYGECWSGPTTKFFRDGASKDCVGIDYKPCNSSAKTPCVGKQFTNYIYTVKDVSSSVVNGGWSDWSAWTSCSQSCNGGDRSRERECSNPSPSGGGDECVGEGEVMEVCNTETCERECDSKLEIGIILDASTSVTKKNWDKTIEFVQRLSKGFKLGPDNVHFGVIQFSWYPLLQFSMSDRRYWYRSSFERKLKSLPYTYGGTRTDLAIQKAEKSFFCKTNCHVRPDAGKVLLVLTDGKQSIVAAPLTDVTRGLKKDGVKMISIGVGQGVDEDELREIASDHDSIFSMSSYNYLDDPINKIIKASCIRQQKK